MLYNVMYIVYICSDMYMLCYDVILGIVGTIPTGYLNLGIVYGLL